MTSRFGFAARSLRRIAIFACTVLLASAALCGPARAETPLLLRNPSLSATKIAFLYADDIWTVSRDGGVAQRLTAENDVVAGPYFSPDGSQIAYSTDKSGAYDVYVIDADGGVPRRLTWDDSGHFFGGNAAVGWTPDGKDVLFDSMRYSFSDFLQLYKTAADGTGTPTVLPLPSAVDGKISPDGQTIAYVPVLQWESAWKHYRGGQTTPIWLVNLKTLDLVKIPRDNSNDSSPVWAGNKTVYFLSDRNGPVSLFSYDTETQQVSQVLDNTGYDLKTVAGGPGALVYEQFGSLHLYDLRSHKQHVVHVTIDGDLPELEPHLANIKAYETQNMDISPTGVRLVVEAHGDIFTLPTDKGNTRNLTQTPGIEERDPAWSPDGKSIAYFSDASGEYQLFIRDQDGLKPPKVIDLGPNASFFYHPHWSPDSKYIAYSDKHLHIWYVDVATGRPVLIDTGLRGGFGSRVQISWSPDSQWIAYTRDLQNQYHGIFLYSLATHKATQITDGMSDAANPAFDPNGKFLYFTASTTGGPSDAGIDLSSLDRWTTSGVYVVVLKRNGASPVPPETGDEKVSSDEKPGPESGQSANSASGQASGQKDKDQAAKNDKEKKPAATVVDLDGIGNRILALPIPQRNYLDLEVGKTGVIYLAEGPAVGRPSDFEGAYIRALWRFTVSDRKTEEVLTNLGAWGVSFNGEKLFYTQGDAWFTIDASALKPGGSQGKPVNNSGMYAVVDPRAEYAQMYRETWRIERDFFYDPHLHGLDLAKIEAKYQPYVAGIASREEFTYLCDEMLGEIEVGHMFIRGPYVPSQAPKTGLLGADYTVENNRYVFSKIYNGQNWTPGLKAPLTLPGINVQAGEYLLAVNGRQLYATDNLYSFFEGTAGKQTTITVGHKPDGSDARDVTVVPTDNEAGLRNLAWINRNIQLVDKLSDNKVAYVYMPNTGGAGYDNFNRYFYSQIGKQGLVLDERYNEGGLIADYIVDVLSRKMLSGAIERDGEPVYDPEGAIFGPKAMIINQSAGSGGDAMPWYFRKAHLGTLVGTRTWGGLVGIGGYPTLMDGGSVTAPRYAIYGLHGHWEVEGHGVPPDVEVQVYPKDVAEGHDLQLERAVQVVMEQLKEHPVIYPVIPPYPNYHEHDGLGTN